MQMSIMAIYLYHRNMELLKCAVFERKGPREGENVAFWYFLTIYHETTCECVILLCPNDHYILQDTDFLCYRADMLIPPFRYGNAQETVSIAKSMDSGLLRR